MKEGPEKKPVKTAKDLSPNGLLDQIKRFASSGSVAGKLRDRQKRIDDAIEGKDKQ